MLCRGLSLRMSDVGRALLLSWAFISFTMDEVTPFPNHIICLYIPGLNDVQRDLCIRYPKLVPIIIQEVPPLFYSECREQFKYERWNCSETIPPIAGDLSKDLKRLSKETAFTYALTSAIMVRVITKACSDGRLQNCSCDTSRQGQTSPQGWQWGGCSDDVGFGVMLTRAFLDTRNNATNKTGNELEASLVNLHNNAVGRTVVSDNMQVKCRCHGASGSCATRTCYSQLPTVRDISTDMKIKYNHSVKVTAHVNRGTTVLRSTSSSNTEAVSPPVDSLVHVKNSVKYCIRQNDYTANRSCIPQNILTQIESNEANPTHYPGYPLPACESLCCSGEYETEEYTVSTTCYCHFVWCCKISCEECEKTLTRYKCTG
ncbi:wingless-type MMTV integration site family [Amphimedon queenslandica]|nr:wingless-type MMTV integration site family [Amphimedon queenslandica]ADO16564.1 WntB [Amphimedon queenslandica]|eukprot:NP_001266204.1 wingless-type MMTV integration site family [Amphimedon queenslandica]